MTMRPILLNSCARAATAAEARFRIDGPIAPTRATRVVALDDGAAPVVRRIAGREWAGARFFTYAVRSRPAGGTGAPAGVLLRDLDGRESHLGRELDGADVAVMVATVNDAATGAGVIGDACTLRGIMTAGLVFGSAREVAATVSALRPHARVLMVTTDEDDLAEVLTALRA